MSPEQMSERLAEWAADREWECAVTRRVVCVEPEGPRRTWLLYEGARQVGHVRMRCVAGEQAEREETGLVNTRWAQVVMRHAAWTWEASDRTREMLGLDSAPQPSQTDPHG
jgi:hypothetical protein